MTQGARQRRATAVVRALTALIDAEAASAGQGAYEVLPSVENFWLGDDDTYQAVRIGLRLKGCDADGL